MGCHFLLQGNFPTQGSNLGTSWQDEALARDGVSREVPCSALKGETVPDSLPALQYSRLGNLKDRGAWGTTVHGVRELDMTYSTTTPPFGCSAEMVGGGGRTGLNWGTHKALELDEKICWVRMV